MNWQVVGQDRGRNDPIIVLDRSRLRASQYALRAIPRRFPKALPRRFQSTERWQRSLRQKLDPLGKFIHESTSLPHWSELSQPAPVIDRAQSLVQRLPRLEPLLHAVFWTYWNDVKSARAALAFLERFEATFGLWLEYKTEPIELDFLKLFRLFQAHPNLLGSILLKFSTREAWVLRMRVTEIAKQLGEQIESISRSFEFLKDGSEFITSRTVREQRELESDYSLELLRLLPPLTHRILKDQRSALTLMDAVLPSEACFARWSEWWTRLEEFTGALPKLQSSGWGPRQFPERQMNALKETLKGIEQAAPKAHSRGDALNLVRNGLSEWRGSVAEEASEILSMIDVSERKQWIRSWHCELQSWKRCLTFIFKELRDFWEDRDGVENWRLWSGVTPYRLTTELWDHYDEGKNSLSKLEVKRLLKVLKTCLHLDLAKPDYEASVFFAENIAFFLGLMRLDIPANKLGQLASRIPEPERRERSVRVLKLLWLLAEKDENQFIKLHSLKLTIDTFRDDKTLGLFKECPKLTALFRSGLLSHHSAVAQSLLKLTLFYFEVHPRETLAVLSHWMELLEPKAMRIPKRYPQNLSEGISGLYQWDSRAEKSLSKVLGKDYPSVEGTKREIAALESLGEEGLLSEAQGQRLRSLKARVGTQANISEARLERLGKKIQGRVQLAQLRLLQNLLDNLLRESEGKRAIYFQVIDKLGVNWLSPLLAIRGLKPRWRKLGEDVLRRRLSDEPWNFIDDSRNASFVNEMEKAGVKMKLWLNETSITKIGEWSLQLERDPLEILLMGRHFMTCLSPFHMNFFATIANCVDINKQVLYARDHKAQVQGRCLLALSRSGQLLHYEIYCHGQERLRAAIQTYIAQLAEQMSCELARTGQVQRLVAPGWYDDGVVDPENKALDSMIARIEEHLSEDEPSLSLAELEAEFGPLRLSLVRELLSRPMFRISPKLLGIFFKARPHWLRESSLHHEALLWAEFNEDHSLLKELLTEIEKSHSWRPWSADRIIQLPRLWLHLGETAKALRFLRRTPWNTRDECEESQERLLLWAECYAAVRRPMKALAYYKRLLYGGCPSTLKKRTGVLKERLMSLLKLKEEEGDSNPLLGFKRKRSLA